MKPGDEVLMTDQSIREVSSPGICAPAIRIVVKKITLPKTVPNAAAVMNLIMMQSRADARAVLQPHHTVTAWFCPPRNSARWRVQRNSLRGDGAHVVGMMRLNLDEMGCDMYTSSPQNGLQAPKAAGFCMYETR